MSTTFRILLEGTRHSFIRQEGDPINGYVLLETYSPITNDNATEDSKSRYNIDQLSGFKVRPGSLVRQWDGLLVDPYRLSKKHPQDMVRVRAERLQGPVRPEIATASELFIDDDDPVTTDDF